MLRLLLLSTEALPPLAALPVVTHAQMTRAFWRMLVGLILLVGFSLTARSAIATAAVQHPQGQWLHGQVQAWEDPSGLLTLDDLLRDSSTLNWKTPEGPLRLHGPSAWWLQIRLVVNAPQKQWVLAFPTTAIRDIQFHGPYASDGMAWGEGAVTGLIQPYPTRPLGMERITYPFQVPFAGEYTLFVRVQNTIPQNITPSLWVLSDYLQNRQHKRLFDGVIYGILLTLLIYNLILTGVFRDKTYLHYVLTCVAALLTIGTFNGHTAHYLWPHQPWWIEHSYVLWPALWLLCNALFARTFLGTRQWGKAIDLPVQIMGGLAVLSLVLGASGAVLTAQKINETLSLLGVATITGLAIWIWRHGHAAAGWYLVAKLPLFVSVVGVVMVARGWWNAPFVLSNGLQMGIAAEMVVFAIALSARIRAVQREKVLLSVRATHLAQEAMTDALTGLANRRGLAESAQRLLAEPGRHAVLLFDLDRFKPINDTHGHEVGDQVLVAIGQRLAQHCRQSDIASRLGGDEFVVVLAHCPDRPALDAMIQRLCDAVDAPINTGGHIHQVSASAGVAIAPDQGRELTRLLRLADQAMYRAKSGGTRFAFAQAPEPRA